MKQLWLLFIACSTSLLLVGKKLESWPLKPAEKRPLNILIVAYTFPKISETFVINQVTGLIDKGHNVRVWAKSPGENKVHETVSNYDLMSRTHYGETPPSDIESFDIALCQFGPLGNEFLEVKELLQLKTKIVTFFRGFDISQYLYQNEGCYDKLLKKSDLIATNCAYFKDRLLELGASPKKTIVYYSAIDCSKFTYSAHIKPYSKDDTIRIVTIGRLVEKKGMEDVVSALHKIVQKGRKAHLTIIGEGNRAKAELQRIAKELGISDCITFAGWCTQDEVARHLKKADVFVLASKTAKSKDQDAIPNALKEAMATGIPVVTTRHGGIPELINDGFNGYLVEEGDSSGIAERVIDLMDNYELRATFSIRGRRAVEDLFDITKQGEALSKLLKKLVFKTVPHSSEQSFTLIQKHIAACYKDRELQQALISRLKKENKNLVKENIILLNENKGLKKISRSCQSKADTGKNSQHTHKPINKIMV